MLCVGDVLPHFDATTLAGERFIYSRIWQRKNLLLVVLPIADRPVAVSYQTQLEEHAAAFSAADTVCLMTLESISGLGDRAVVIADRWGEIVYVATAVDASTLPAPSELLEWVGYVQRRCPECEGETK
jgi:peroxiredoxin